MRFRHTVQMERAAGGRGGVQTKRHRGEHPRLRRHLPTQDVIQAHDRRRQRPVSVFPPPLP